jgi:hypothetical protein
LILLLTYRQEKPKRALKLLKISLRDLKIVRNGSKIHDKRVKYTAKMKQLTNSQTFIYEKGQQLSLLADENRENEDFLSDQIITYLGNKRSLLDFIGNALAVVQKELGKEKLDCVDIFSGSGIVSRYLKRFSNNLYVNDLESYCKTINTCYLAH